MRASCLKARLRGLSFLIIAASATRQLLSLGAGGPRSLETPPVVDGAKERVGGSPAASASVATVSPMVSTSESSLPHLHDDESTTTQPRRSPPSEFRMDLLGPSPAGECGFFKCYFKLVIDDQMNQITTGGIWFLVQAE